MKKNEKLNYFVYKTIEGNDHIMDVSTDKDEMLAIRDSIIACGHNSYVKDSKLNTIR